MAMTNNWLDLIMQRRSVRSFSQVENLENKDEAVLEFIKAQKNLFGSEFTFTLIPGDGLGGKIGTYGIIKNPAFYLAPKAKKNSYHPVDYGYVIEKTILFALSLGLGSCWLGGTFSKSSLVKSSGLGADEEIPALVAMGLPAKKSHFAGRANRFLVGSDKRRDPNTLFFLPDGSPVPLSPQDPLTQLLESILIAPSASNKQPWRVVVDDHHFHFFLKRTPSYNRMIKVGGIADLQVIDMGIAMAHLELAASSLGRESLWINTPNVLKLEDKWEYLMSCEVFRQP